MKYSLRLSYLCILFIVLICTTAIVSADDYNPYNYEYTSHTVGKLDFMISNAGAYGFNYYDYSAQRRTGFVYPKNSNIIMGTWCNLWIGGIVGSDTLVSTGQVKPLSEFTPIPGDEGLMQCRSLLKGSDCPNKDAVSEQDFVCVYNDTVTNPAFTRENQYDNRRHKPLNVSITQSSYAWSFDYADDIILVDYQITNIGRLPIREMYIGISTYDGQTGYAGDTEYRWDGDHALTGFLETASLPEGNCMESDTVNIAWHADKSGRSNEAGEWDYKSNRSVFGIKVLRPTPEQATFNYNWFVYAQYYNYFGPRMAGTDDDPFREFSMPLALPAKDEEKYYVLSHPERDYDQMFTALNHSAEGFLPSPNYNTAVDLADGAPVEYLYSFGPFDVAPGDTIPVTIAFVCAENFHVNPQDFNHYFDPFNPTVFYDHLDFSNLIENVHWAEAIFDNPGFDTDADGYAGEYCWIYTWKNGEIVDSVRQYYTGDSIPDFRAMSPPPPPTVWTHPEFGSVTIRWNGQESETTPDYFSHEIDFEGYNVYFGEGNRLTDFVKVASYDIDDYIVYVFDEDNLAWNLLYNSATLDSLRRVHGVEFDPHEYDSPEHYFIDHTSDQILFFKPQGWNQSQLNSPGTIRKVYPDASPDDPTDLTEEGYMRCYEYEFTLDNLEASKDFYFAVTAFDYGAENFGIGKLETSPLTNAIREYPLPSSQTVADQGLKVMVYPNPYRINGGYARAGYENRDRLHSADWSREIHFANLPPVCKIRIFTIDGDLVKEIDHYHPDAGPATQEET